MSRVGQYVFSDKITTESEREYLGMKLLQCVCCRVPRQEDSKIVDYSDGNITTSLLPAEEAFYIKNLSDLSDINFKANATYYLHLKIRRPTSGSSTKPIKTVDGINYSYAMLDEKNLASYNIWFKLVNLPTEDSDDRQEQFIKRVTITQKAYDDTSISEGEEHKWVDVELLFTPVIDFKYFVFSLDRNLSDFSLINTNSIKGKEDLKDFIETINLYSMRFPKILICECSVLQNILKPKVNSSVSSSKPIVASELLKMGIQSNPGLKVCVNHEEIQIGRTGIYEMRHSEIVVNFLSIIFPYHIKNDLSGDTYFKTLINGDDNTKGLLQQIKDNEGTKLQTKPKGQSLIINEPYSSYCYPYYSKNNKQYTVFDVISRHSINHQMFVIDYIYDE